MARPRRSNPDATGRSSGIEPFLKIERWMFDCPAYRTLKPGPRALMLELIRLFNGSNNGRIGMGVRTAGRALGVEPGTVGGYFHKLEDAGFIVATQRAGFNMKAPGDRTATEWRLTWLPSDGQAPTKEFMRPRESNFDGVESPLYQCGKSTPGIKPRYPIKPERYGKSTLGTPIQAAYQCGKSTHI